MPVLICVRQGGGEGGYPKLERALKMKRQEIMCSFLVCGDVAFTSRGVPTFKIRSYTVLQLFRFSFSVLFEWTLHEFLCR